MPDVYLLSSPRPVIVADSTTTTSIKDTEIFLRAFARHMPYASLLKKTNSITLFFTFYLHIRVIELIAISK